MCIMHIAPPAAPPDLRAMSIVLVILASIAALAVAAALAPAPKPRDPRERARREALDQLAMQAREHERHVELNNRARARKAAAVDRARRELGIRRPPPQRRASLLPWRR